VRRFTGQSFLARSIVPGKVVPGKVVPGKVVPGKVVPGKTDCRVRPAAAEEMTIDALACAQGAGSR
jgi:hypothetical protein